MMGDSQPANWGRRAAKLEATIEGVTQQKRPWVQNIRAIDGAYGQELTQRRPTGAMTSQSTGA